MKRIIINTILLVMALASALPMMGQGSDAVLRDKITEAVMKVYDEQIAQDPNDYNTLFARAHQHFYDGNYTAALADVNQAMLITPATDKEVRFDEHILRARIYDARQDYASELADLQLALALQPKSLACTDLIAKANLKAGNLDAAEKAFKTILRAEAMNYDAMYGMALVEQARGNQAAAIEQAGKAVSLFRVEPQVYVNRADIYARQGNIDAAVHDLIDGMSVGDGGNAARRLFSLSDTHYDAVMSALNTIADKNPDASGVYRYLRANIAIQHNRFAQALKELNVIKNNHLYDSPMVDFKAARCCLELARYDQAIQLIDQAIAQDQARPEFYLIKSRAAYYAGDGHNHAAAFEALDRCSAIVPQYVPMLIAKAELYAAQGNDSEALGYLNAALANDKGNPEALYLRARLFQRIGNDTLAAADWNTMQLLGDEPFALKGLAQGAMGKDNDAFSWLNKITSTNLPGGENFYYAAIFMASRGDNYKAMEYLGKALELGYGSLHNLEHEELSAVNLKTLRHEAGFDLLVDKAMRNFSE